LLYQAAHTELIMSDRYWPDFGRDEFAAAIAEFQRRQSVHGNP
jgi:undecaprenyl diphosphate synthase